MRIFHVLEAVGGGTSLHLKTLALAQRRYGDEVVVAAPSRRAWGFSDVELISELRAGSIDVVEVPLHSLPIHPRNLRARRMLSVLLSEHRPHVVHTHSTAAGAIARVVARRLRIPTVHSPHGVRFADVSAGPASIAALLLERLMASFTDRVIASSPSEAEVLTRAYPRKRIKIVPNGLCPKTGPPPAFPELPRIVSVHRLTHQKNPVLGIHIMSMTRKQRPEVEAAVVGDGPLASEVASSIERIDPGIQLIPSGRGSDVMAGATAVLLCSRWEGGPYVPLESMGLGRPVVASDVVGSRDVVAEGETGFLYDPSRPDIASRRLVELIDDRSLAAAMGAAGRQRLEEHYGVQQMVDGMRETYESVLT